VRESVYQRVLGKDFPALAPELQSYFGMPDAGFHGRGVGVFDVAGSRYRWLWPVFRLLAHRRILFPEYARDVPFTVVNRPDGDSLRATRTFHFVGRDRAMVDEMRVVDGRLHDFLGRRGGLEVALSLAVADGALTMESTGVWLRIARLRLPVSLGARLTLNERWEQDHQRVSVALRHPLLGEFFAYRGTFTYSWVRDET
jgi:Domain of unknown function (DUF4166)